MDQSFFDFQTNPAAESPLIVEPVGTPHIFTISEITEEIRSVVEGSFVDLWVTGEVTNFKNRTGRHWYFSLKDDKSQLRAVIFSAASRRLNFDLVDGLEVICHGKLNLYAPRGDYSLIIDHLEPKGIGALQLAFEQLKKRLEEEGLFRREYKKPLPFLPKKIGIVTSPTGAAIRDMIQVLARRFPGVGILLAPVRVQGEGAAAEIAEAIAFLNARDDVDLLIVGRGGGSIEDLWAFNEEVVARAIFASRIPIIAAVGHEIDFTIADFVADVRAPTPSAAAEMAVPVKEELRLRAAELRRQLAVALRQGLMMRAERLSLVRRRIKDPTMRFPDLLLRIDSFCQRIIYATTVGLERRGDKLAKLASNLDHLSPLAVLAKGYAVVERSSTKLAVRKAADLNVGEELRILFAEGEARAAVTKIGDVSRSSSS